MYDGGVQILDLLIDYALLDYGEAIDTICRDLGARRYINMLHPGSGLAVLAPCCPLLPCDALPLAMARAHFACIRVTGDSCSCQKGQQQCAQCADTERSRPIPEVSGACVIVRVCEHVSILCTVLEGDLCPPLGRVPCDINTRKRALEHTPACQEGKVSEEYALAGNHTGLLRVIWHMKNSRSSLRAVHQGDREGLEAIEQEIRSG